MGADDAGCGGGGVLRSVVLVFSSWGGCCCGGCDFCDADARRVCCEDGVWWREFCEFGEDGLFEGGDLGDGFDYHVDCRFRGGGRGGEEI